MSELVVASITFLCVFGGALLGLFLRGVLPEHQLSDAAKDVVKLVTGLVATLSALVLGLLIASAKNSFDAVNEGLRQAAARVIVLDRVLAQYGSETKAARELLRSGFAARVDRIFPEERSPQGTQTPTDGIAAVEEVQQRVRAFSPQSDAQRAVQLRAVQLAGEVAQAHWLAIEEADSTIPRPFLVVLVFWLAAMFAAFGLFAPRNATAIVALFVGALSISTSIFLIEELNNSLEGLIAAPSGPMRTALTQLGR
jgi:hypothetical protein